MIDHTFPPQPFSPRFLRLQAMIDACLTWLAMPLRLCGHGPDMGWSVRIAELFFTDCACCVFWRGVMVGLLAALGMTGVLVLLIASPSSGIVAGYGLAIVSVLWNMWRVDGLAQRLAQIERRDEAAS
jgi:hypothetical protein